MGARTDRRLTVSLLTFSSTICGSTRHLRCFTGQGGAAVSANVGNEALTGLTIGARFSARSFNDGDIAEIIVYNASLTLEEINDVGGYLSTKYGLTWTEAT